MLFNAVKEKYCNYM